MMASAPSLPHHHTVHHHRISNSLPTPNLQNGDSAQPFVIHTTGAGGERKSTIKAALQALVVGAIPSLPPVA